MIREDFNFPSADKRTEIHSIRWLPDSGIEVRAILQIAHGMEEYIERYAPFAEFLTGEGFVVTGNDHLGHGKSIIDKNYLGYFPPRGNKILIRDMRSLRQMTARRYPDLPYFMMGHSMGSFLVREYLCLHASNLAGAILMGTGDTPKSKLSFAQTLAGFLCSVRGRMGRDKLLNNMAFSGYNKRIRGGATGKEWLSRDEEQVRKYVEDPLCGFPFTNNAFYEFFKCMLFLKNPENLMGMPKDLPVLFVSGAEDPVGNYGRGVRIVEEQFRETGLRDVTCTLYPEDRHELLNEIDRATVYQDLLTWMLERMPADHPES